MIAGVVTDLSEAVHGHLDPVEESGRSQLGEVVVTGSRVAARPRVRWPSPVSARPGRTWCGGAPGGRTRRWLRPVDARRGDGPPAARHRSGRGARPPDAGRTCGARRRKRPRDQPRRRPCRDVSDAALSRLHRTHAALAATLRNDPLARGWHQTRATAAPASDAASPGRADGPGYHALGGRRAPS